MKIYRDIFFSIFSASLLALAYPSANLWLFAWLAFIPLFFAVSGKKFLNAFLLGFLAGIVFFYCVISWLNSIAVMATVSLVLYLALYFALFSGFAASAINKKAPAFLKCVFIASAWAALEFIRAHIFTGFGWALLGYSQAGFLPAIQIADITGPWGVSFIVMFVNVVIYEFFFVSHVILRSPKGDEESKQNDTLRGLLRNRLINFLCCIFLIATVFIYGFCSLGDSPTFNATATHGTVPIKISLIQGNIPQSLKWDEEYRNDIIKKYFALTEEAAAETPDIIIWPETSFPADLYLEPALAKSLFNLAIKAKSYLLVGANRFGWDSFGKYEKIYNSAYLISPEGEIMQYYDKLHLVPFGEYMPRVPKILYKILPEKINMVGDFSPGESRAVFKSPTSFSALICFEDVFPELSAEFSQRGAKMLINITNDAWYGVSSAPFQHAQASVFRAVENRVPVARAANTGLSAFIDEKGRIFDQVTPFTSGYKTSRVFINQASPGTFYNNHRYVFVVICFLILITSFAII